MNSSDLRKVHKYDSGLLFSLNVNETIIIILWFKYIYFIFSWAKPEADPIKT